ncbi:hypothetical protein ACFSKW_45560 [Nonomuraea mangrovi]|uniref:Uncharacterized protein n=1 Tax=Nonomuraea mangrovi TaxID=2316207 RepID=A0ABW4TBT7_9ACTN
MSLKNINTVLATAGALFILYIGVSYVLTPETSAPNFGLPGWPSGDGEASWSSRTSATSSQDW